MPRHLLSLLVAALAGFGCAEPLPESVANALNAPASCGNGALDLPAEGCEIGDTLSCSDLGASWTAGTATCRSTCRGYDTTSCTRHPYTGAVSNNDWFVGETVRPAERDARWDDAVCNTGRAFGYEVHLAPNPTNEWVIVLGGGGFGTDYASPLADRAVNTPQRVNGTGKDDADWGWIRLGGVFDASAANPEFADANHVFATYCDSSLWVGARDQPVATSASVEVPGHESVTGMDYWFSGRQNVRAMLQSLMVGYGLDDNAPDTKVLFAGTSAGGHGVLGNAAMVRRHLPRTATNGRLRLVVDAGFVPMFQPPPPPQGIARVGGFQGTNIDLVGLMYDEWGSKLNTGCEDAMVSMGSHPGLCHFAEFSMPFVAGNGQGGLNLPVLVQQSVRDIAYAPLHSAGYSPAQEAAWSTAMMNTLGQFDWVFSGPGPYHTLLKTSDPAKWTMAPPLRPNESFDQVLGRFWNDDLTNPSPEWVVW